MEKEKEIRKKEKAEKEKFYEEIVKDTVNDFLRRQKNRVNLERQWELNMDFLEGRQYKDVGRRGEIVDTASDYYWQKKEVYNHIAPLIETRLSRFSRVVPVVGVRPKTDDDDDVSGASFAEKLLQNVFESYETDEVIKKVNLWSETCGSGFYKIVWDNRGGSKIGELDGKEIYEGDVKIQAVSPFEIFPDNLFKDDFKDCDSIIQARAVSVGEIKEKYGVSLMGEDIDVYDLSKTVGVNGQLKSVYSDSQIVIEKYEKPSAEFPNGRLITVAKDKLLYYGELPYINGVNGERGYPFIKQDCITVPGSFFGTSVIERLIPVQRAFNAVKNRKHEFINRLSAGVMAVEDGSCDVDDLESEGLCPGKVLVYRQGSKAPEIMDNFTMPSEFNEEEDKLVNEFVTVSGVAEISSSLNNAKMSSASALEILIEQDNERIISTAENIRKSYLEIARHVIRLYRQFLAGIRAIKSSGNNGKMQVYYIDGNAVKSDDVYLENDNEMLYSYAQKREMLFKLYESGLLNDEGGKLRAETKSKVLTLLGYKDLDYQKGITKMQEEKAQNENDKIRKSNMPIEEIDDDNIHVSEHTRYILCEYDELTEEEKANLFAHLRAHKERIKKVEGEK